MADDISRILQLAGLARIDEAYGSTSDVDYMEQHGLRRPNGAGPQTGPNFKKKFMAGKPASHNRQEEDECMMDEDEFDVADNEIDGDVPEIESDDVTISLPRSCAEWLKNHLSGGMDNSEESGMVMDAIDQALCGDEEGCEDGMDGDVDDAADDISGDLDMDGEGQL